MAKQANQKIKLLYLMKIMYDHTDDENGLTLAEITEKLLDYGITAERKTLYDDIETLSVFGMDIEKRKDKTVRYHVVSRDFELPELKLLVDAVQASKFITRKKSDELIKKIEGFCSHAQGRKLQRQVFTANRIKTMNESIYYTVDHIHDAINHNVKIAFQYFDWNEDKEKVLRHKGKVYQISPFALCWDDENYYMIGYDDEAQKIKHYRVDKMTGLSLTDIPRDGADLFKNFDMGVYSKKTFGMYGGREETVLLRCHNDLARVMIDRFGLEPVFHKVSDTHFEMRIKVHISPPFLTWLMNFGKDVTVISPQSVREELVKLASDLLQQYTN